MECKKCGTELIIDHSCMPNPELEKKHKKKEITYYITGDTTYGPSEIDCAKCGENIKTGLKEGPPRCPKCNLEIVDAGCEMYGHIQKMADDKKLIYIVGKTAAQIEITCVKCGTKFKYDRAKGVVK